MNLNNELNGITVLSLEQAVAAPYCGMLLANAGARVIKVERLDGDFARGYDSDADGKSTIFAWLNRGKESICLNINKNSDKDLLSRMIAKSDVLLSNLAPGTLNRKGFSQELVRKLNRKIINCSISGYGSGNSTSKAKAYDFLIQGEAGLCAVTGTEKHPSKVGISITDISTGLTAFSAILRALIQRSQNGNGVDIEISMFDVIADWMNMPLMAHRYGGGAPKRMALSHSFVAPYGAFETADNYQILLSIQNEREWKSFCVHVLRAEHLINDERLADNVTRYKNKVYLEEKINQVFRDKTKKYLIKKLTKANIAFSNLNSVEDLSNHKLLRNKEINFGGTLISIADLPLCCGVTGCSTVPLLDEHGESLRNEFKMN